MDISACVEDEWIKVSGDDIDIFLMPVLDKVDHYVSFVLTEVRMNGRSYQGNLFYRNDEARFIYSFERIVPDIPRTEFLERMNDAMTSVFLWLREQIDVYDVWKKEKLS